MVVHVNVNEIIRNVNIECQPITNIDNFIRRQCKKAQDKICMLSPQGGWKFLFVYDSILTLESGVKEYALSPLVDTSKIINIFDEDNKVYLTPQLRQKALMNYPSNTSSGNPYQFVLKGFWPVKKQPAAVGVLTFVSSSAADTSNVNIQYLNGDDLFIEENITLTGTTDVATVGSVKKVLSLYKNEKTTGIITVTDSSANEMLSIAPKMQSVSCPVIEFYSVPTSSYDIYYDYSMKLMPIYDDNDVSLLPDNYHEGIELFAKFQTYKTLTKWNEAKLTEKEFYDFIESMKLDVYTPLQTTQFEKYSDVGSPYPVEYKTPTVTIA